MGPGEARYQARAWAEVAATGQIFREIMSFIARLRGPPHQRDRQTGSIRQTPPIKGRAAKSRGQGGRGSVDADRCSPPCRINHEFRLPCNFSSP